ncbi:multiple inositol polyphosphate phosphatase 1-like [Anticarsia gemmatalis]|uniref:multiple inositol polyphosphate phosphatase 1-like n=1 Tax=Anticarsia gemmatalis TaxID=129554 RepID=UPI003F76ACFA
MGLYDLCRYSWNGIADKQCPWCAFFTSEDLKILEYITDQFHYYRNGYGNKYSKLLGEIILADLFQRFEAAKDGKGKKIIVYFSHATAMDMMFVALDLFKDERPPTGAYRDPNRKWKTAKISTFGANLLAVLNRCKGTDDVQDYHVAFYLNEEPLLELCSQGVCSWQEFEDKFKPFTNTTLDFCEQ